MKNRPPTRSPLAREWGELTAATIARQERAAAKAMIYADQFKPLVEKRIAERCSDPERVRQMKRHASTTVNVAKSIADAVATCYGAGVRRYLAGVPEPAAQAFASLVAESDAALQQAAWGTSAWLLGPTLVVPHVDADSRRLVLSAIRPDCFDAKLGPGRGLDALLWRVDDANAWALVDRTAWRYFDEDGKPTGTVPHGLGYVPAATFRSVPELFGGFWGSASGDGIFDASLDAAVVYATMGYFRTVQAGYLTVVAADRNKLPAGQSITEVEMPLHFDGDASELSVQAIDRDVGIENFLRHLNAIVSIQVQQHGIPASEVTFEQNSANWGALALSIRGEKLGTLRNRQVPLLHRAERDLWSMAADVVRRSDHPLAGAMPERDAFEAALRVEFPDVNTLDPKSRLDLYDRELAKGFTSPVEFFQATHPDLTREECQARIDANLESYYATVEEMTRRNIGTGPAGAETVAQLAGRLGAATRDAGYAGRETQP